MCIQSIKGFFPMKRGTRTRRFLSVYVPLSSRRCPRGNSWGLLTKTFRRPSWRKGSQRLAWFPVLTGGTPEKPVLFLPLDFTEAGARLYGTPFPVGLTPSELTEAFPPGSVFLVNTQLLRARVSQVRWGHREPLASCMEELDFWEVCALSPSAWIGKGPLSSFEGRDRCQKPHKPSPGGVPLPAGPRPHQRWLELRGSLRRELATFPWMKGGLTQTENVINKQPLKNFL